MSAVAKLQWYRHRIAAMSGPELMHRAREKYRREHDKYLPGKLIPAAIDYGALPMLPGLREGLQAWQVPLSLIAEWEEQMRQAQSGEFYLLGQQWPRCDADKKWHLDPVSGSYWPDKPYCFSINYRHNDKMGDIKYVWELNRLQYLQPVAALAFRRKDPEIAAYCLREIDSWILHNPPHRGVNWSSGIELALRIASIFVIVTLINDYIGKAQRTRIWAMLEAHALWLERYPSKFSSANNHQTAEGLGLFLIGALCPQMPGAQRWKDHGWELLCDTAQLQILPDGVGAEQTPNYTAVVLEMLLLGVHVAKAQQIAVPYYYTSAIVQAGECLRWFTDEGGNTPRIGDDDNARVLGVYRKDEQYILSVLSCIAALASRADLSPPKFTPHLRQALFGFPPPPEPGPTGVRLFSDGGYTVGRTQSGKHSTMLVIDHGPLGYLSIAAHGHADALSIWLHVDGMPVFVDSGTYLYHSGGAWRNYFRGTGAHNTLRVEGADSSLMSGHFNWSQKAKTTLIDRQTVKEQWMLDAEHDGYLKAFGVFHRRRLVVTPGSSYVIEDWLTGPEPRNVDIGFLLHPALRAEWQGDYIAVLKDKKRILRMRHEGPLAAEIAEAGTDKAGWYSPTFSVKEPAAKLIFAGTLAPQEKAITHILLEPGHGA